eukprot:CAMPEP_0173274558 /NCGR_PEP_ID=MMETSP1143-20121109/2506_1 /TAXON_ID=483371 /ORGANISM="non described non described, Strain CCMP2298" /LENGTH=65 /DNA_ID=CAMNT_0014211381 /DNA_START=625 /DNA_END=819 /DNA_ORIENTATION=+
MGRQLLVDRGHVRPNQRLIPPNADQRAVRVGLAVPHELRSAIFSVSGMADADFMCTRVTTSSRCA